MFLDWVNSCFFVCLFVLTRTNLTNNCISLIFTLCLQQWMIFIPLIQKSHRPVGQLLHCHLISESHKETFSIFMNIAFISKILETLTEAAHYNPIDSLSPKINKSLTHCTKCYVIFHIHIHTLLHFPYCMWILFLFSCSFYLFKMGKIELFIDVNLPFHVRFDETVLRKVSLVGNASLCLVRKLMLNWNGRYQLRLDPFMQIWPSISEVHTSWAPAILSDTHYRMRKRWYLRKILLWGDLLLCQTH